MKIYKSVVKWTRRGSSVAVVALLLQAIATDLSPLAALRSLLMPFMEGQTALPPERALAATLLIWYAFLSQLRFTWALWLPIYLATFPMAWAVFRLAAFGARPLWGYLQTLAPAEAKTIDVTPIEKAPPPQPQPWSVPTKRLWLFGFFVYLVVFRGLDVGIAIWIPPVLALPFWWSFLRLAYNAAMTPRTMVSWVIKGCSLLLDLQIKAVNEAKEKNKAYKPAQFVLDLAAKVMARYADDRVLSVIQRESLAVFSVALVMALCASSVFWGLVITAAMHASPSVSGSYAFFTTGSIFEAVLWAWGCMTTAIGFPGSAAPLWLKAIHALILTTGLFQLTFLFACFSIMTSSEGQRAAEEARRALHAARIKLEETRALEAVVVTVVQQEASAEVS